VFDRCKILFALMLFPWLAHGQSRLSELKEVPLYETSTKPYSSAEFTVDAGKSIGKVSVDLKRDVEASGSFLGLKLRYEKFGVVEVPRRFISCIVYPAIEYSAFYFTEFNGDAPSAGWFSSIEIPFGPAGSSDEDDDGDYIKIRRFPAIEFEVAGGKAINRVRIKKSDSEVKVVKDINGECPEELVKWAIGAAGK